MLLQAENARLHERLATVVAQLAALQGKSPPEQLQLELTKLQEQMAKLQQKMFGRSSEKSKKQDEAKKFLEWFIRDDVQQKWAELGGYSCSQAVLKSDKFLDATP